METAVVISVAIVALVTWSRWRARRVIECIEAGLSEESSEFELERARQLRRRLRGLVPQQPIDHGNEPE